MKARVILKGAKTYKLHGRKWIKDVPVMLHDEDAIKEVQANGRYQVFILSAAKKKKVVSSDELSVPKKKFKKKTGKKKLRQAN